MSSTFLDAMGISWWSGGGGSVLLKQARVPNASRTVASEAMIYRAFQALPASHPLRRHTVPFLEYDDDERVLLLRCVADARHWRRIRIKAGFPSGRRRSWDRRRRLCTTSSLVRRQCATWRSNCRAACRTLSSFTDRITPSIATPATAICKRCGSCSPSRPSGR